MTNALSHLDTDELLHLALAASTRDAHGDALDYLKQAVTLAPDHAKVRYLLGAEYAQIAMYDRAALEMEHAIRLAPTFHIARFQLGLLHLTSGNVGAAKLTWAALEELGEEHALCQFARGLLCMADNNFDACRTHLTRGIALNTENAALNEDMRRMLETVPTSVTAEGESEADGANQIFLSAYTTGTPH